MGAVEQLLGGSTHGDVFQALAPLLLQIVDMLLELFSRIQLDFCS